MENDNVTIFKITEEKANSNDLPVEGQLDTEIQRAYLNVLHDLGVLSDNIHSAALSKAMKGMVL